MTAPEMDIHIELAPVGGLVDATILGAFTDEIRGYISERMRAHKFQHAVFEIITTIPGYDPEVTRS